MLGSQPGHWCFTRYLAVVLLLIFEDDPCPFLVDFRNAHLVYRNTGKGPFVNFRYFFQTNTVPKGGGV